MDESTISNEPTEMSDEELQAALEAAEAEIAREEREKQEVLNDLGRAITGKLKVRQGRRAIKEQEWIVAKQLKLLGVANTGSRNTSPDRPFDPSNYSNRPEKNIVRDKCEIAVAQLMSMQFSGGEKNWDSLPPDEIPQDMPDIFERCEAMEHTIANQLEECEFKLEAHRTMEQWAELGTGVMKGPLNYGKMKRTYVAQQDPMTGKTSWVSKVTPESKPYLSFVDIWTFYPDDTVTDINKAEDTIQLHPMSYMEMQALRDNAGFMASVIDEILEARPDEHPSDSYANQASVVDGGGNLFRNKYTVAEYHGPITLSQLNKLDIDPSYDMPGESYFGEVWVVNGKVIRIELENIEGSHKPPYSGVVWHRDPSSPFGYGICIMLRDHQRVVSECWHMILDNASASSGPQIIMSQDMIEPADGSYELHPNKIWYFTDIGSKVGDAIELFDIPNLSASIFEVMREAEAAAERESGIPLMIAGLQSPQIGTDSATGLSIIEQASTTFLDYKSSEWDKCITGPRLTGMYDWNMQYNPDDSIKAPMTMRVRAASEYRNKQRHIKDMEKLIVQAGQNPAVGDEVNMSNLVRAQISMMSLPTLSIIKSYEQKQAEAEEKAANPPPPSPDEIKAQAEMARIELEKERLGLERMKMEFEMGQGQRREEMEFQERMTNTYARVAEAEAQVVKSQNEKEIALLQLAAKAGNEAERERLTAGIALQNDATSRFTAGLQHEQKSRDQLIKLKELQQYDEELKLKKQGKTGI